MVTIRPTCSDANAAIDWSAWWPVGSLSTVERSSIIDSWSEVTVVSRRPANVPASE